MHFSKLLLASVATQLTAATTVYMAGDSTMAKGGGGVDTQGWGEYLKYSMNSSITVVNDAKAGRSARSYTREGRFDTIISAVKKGDFVIIEFGHNDGGSLTPTDDGRTDCPGTGSETCSTVYDGVAETVLTYPAYLTNAAKSIIAKGAKVVICPPTPSNPDETGTFTYTPNRFTTYTKSVASTTGATWVDHGQYVANAYKALSVAKVDAFFPHDHTHTSPEGANLVAAAFVKGLLCEGLNGLADYVKNSTSSVSGSCI